MTSIKQILGITWINFIFYRVMILQRESYIISNKIALIQSLIIVGVLVINLIELYSIVKLIFKWNKVGTLTKYMVKIINLVYWKPLRSIAEEIMKVPGIGKVLISIGKALLYMLKDKEQVLGIVLLYTILPRTLIGISLCIDIIYYSKMSIMYKVIFIVVYTLSFHVIIGLVKHYCTDRKQELEDKSLIPTYENKELVMYTKDTSLDNEGFSLKVEAWLLYHNLLDVILAIELVKQYWFILGLRLINVIMFITAWCSYLYIVYH